MKRFHFWFFILAAFIFISCSEISDDDSSSSSTDTETSSDDDSSTTYAGKKSNSTAAATLSKTWTYDESNPIYEISSDVSSVSVSGDIGGKNVYLAKVNKSSSSISSSNLRKITQSTTVSSDSEITLQNGSRLDGRPDFKNFVPPEDIGETLKNAETSSSARSATTTSISTVSQISPVVDSTTKSIYIDNDVNLSSYTTKTATLRAIGTYCYVWVVDDYYTSGEASGSKVSSTTAQTFASKFDEIYPMIRNVFGEESDYLINYSTSTTSYDASLAMTSYSDTGTMVNIVIYDIGADSESSSSSQCGVVGYFYSKDYVYPTSTLRNSVIQYSNKGKYFYVDSAYAVEYFDTTISTLAHEFQHMINFNQKNILQNLSPSTNYNEMLSMLCEDMMQEQLGIGDEDSPKARLQGFNAYYFLSGISEYNSSYAVVSYATSYAFGAWLCRNYGGAALIQAMSANSEVDNDSIVAAVNSVNGTSYDFDTLFEQFLLALTGNGTYTMNKNAAQTLSYGDYKYPMTTIDLWSSDYSISSDGISDYSSVQSQLSEWKYADYDWTGPFLFSNSNGYTLRPEYGITLHEIGTLDSDKTSATYTFSSSGSSNLTMYLIIQ